MSTTMNAPAMTAEEFAREYAGDNRFELIRGEVCEREMNGFTHFLVKNRINKLFDAAGIEKLGFMSFVEASFLLTPGSGVTADVSVIRIERLKSLWGNAVVPGAPEIAIEVAITDNASLLESKVEDYFAAGAHSVCIVYPRLRKVIVYSGDRRLRLTAEDTLQFPDLLPGIAIPVAAIFDSL